MAEKPKKPAESKSTPKSKAAVGSAPPGASGPLQAGTKAPGFELASSSGKSVSLTGLKGHPVLLYFYPKADTPGCTKQACQMNDALGKFKKLGVQVYGISPDPASAVTKFGEKFSLKFPLLADEDHATSEAFGVWVEKSMYGRTYMGVARTSFLIDSTGVIRKVFEKVKPETHDDDVLQWLGENPIK